MSHGENPSPLFDGWWADLAGNRTRRATKRELAEATRLWVKHQDVRRGHQAEDFGAWMETLPGNAQG